MTPDGGEGQLRRRGIGGRKKKRRTIAIDATTGTGTRALRNRIGAIALSDTTIKIIGREVDRRIHIGIRIQNALRGLRAAAKEIETPGARLARHVHVFVLAVVKLPNVSRAISSLATVLVSVL